MTDGDPRNDRNQLLALAHSLDTTWDAHNLEAFVALFTEDATFGPIDGIIARGQDEIRQLYGEQVFPSLPPGRHHVSSVIAMQTPKNDVAIVDVTVSLEQEADDGSRACLANVPAITVAIHTATGWRLAAVRLGPAIDASQSTYP